jgi:hypothetical protein
MCSFAPCKGPFRLRVDALQKKKTLPAVQTTRVDASKKKSKLDFFSVDARSVNAEFVSHLFELGVDVGRRAQSE